VIGRLALLSWVLLLSACAGKTVRVDDGGGMALISERTAVLAPMQFELEGRVGFSDGKQAGSGEIRWRQERMVDTLDLRVPLAQRSYRVRVEPERATLDDGRGERVAGNVGRLLAPIFGFEVPFDALKLWTRGAAANPESAQLNDSGDLTRVVENGWTIDYRDFKPVGTQRLPHRVFARQGELSVRLNVAEWRVR
jgi:outer membrane lipoprotein LolB